MKLILRLILVVVIAYFASTIFPWWIIILTGFLIGFILPGNGFSLFLSGFIGGGLLWLGYAWKTDIETDQIVSSKIVSLIPMINDITYLLILTGVIGGVSAGLGMLTGNSFRKIFMRKKTSGMYHS